MKDEKRTQLASDGPGRPKTAVFRPPGPENPSTGLKRPKNMLKTTLRGLITHARHFRAFLGPLRAS